MGGGSGCAIDRIGGSAACITQRRASSAPRAPLSLSWSQRCVHSSSPAAAHERLLRVGGRCFAQPTDSAAQDTAVTPDRTSERSSLKRCSGIKARPQRADSSSYTRRDKTTTSERAHASSTQSAPSFHPENRDILRDSSPLMKTSKPATSLPHAPRAGSKVEPGAAMAHGVKYFQVRSVNLCQCFRCVLNGTAVRVVSLVSPLTLGWRCCRRTSR